MQERLQQNVSEKKSDLGDLSSIPTDDAQAALQFCRSLARVLAASATHLNANPSRAIDGLKASMSAQETQPGLSVIVPVYNEGENIAVLYTRLAAALQQTQTDYEVIFVDDGSGDDSAQRIRNLTEKDQRVKLVELARNFGHQVAITAGLDFARGNVVAIMDADLQDPPEALPAFIGKWREGYDVVYAVREQRKEGWLKRTSYAAFYRLLRHVSNIDIPLDAGDFCVMDRRVVDLLKSMPERNRFMRGIRSWVGLKQIGVPFERQARHAGKSKYSVFGLFFLALDGLVSFSYVPLRVITLLGFVVSTLSILLALFYVAVKLQLGLNPPGFATIIVAIFFLAGIQLITLGVIGEYVGRIFEEAKRRPLYVLRGVPGPR